jgi:hypothetical protein
MKRMLFSRLFFLVVLACAGLVLGCGQKEVALAPVSGKVTVDGQPLTSGSVSLVPDVPLGNEGAQVADKMATPGLSGGKIEPDGTYKIYTGGKEGAPLGKYKVRVVPPQTETNKDKDAKGEPDIGYKREYTDANKTPLHYEVVANPQAGAYDLKLKK